MEAHEMKPVERPRKGIWYVVGSVPLLTEMLMLVLDRLHRLSLLIILLVDIAIIAAAFACAYHFVPREDKMVVSARHCIEYNYGPLGPPGLSQDNNSWFQSWRVDAEDFACMRVEPHAQERHNRELFRNFFIDGKLHTSFQMPVRANRTLVRFNRGQRYLKGYITIDLDLSNNSTQTASNASIRLRLGGRDGGGRQSDWRQLGITEVPLRLDACETRLEQSEDGEAKERCVVNQRLFETTSLDSEFYLLNAGVRHMRLPPISMALVVVHQTRLYTLACLHVQACCAGLLLLLLAVFGLRVRRVYRAVPAGHRLLALLALALLLWDVPLGYIALDCDMPWLGLLDAIRLDVFYLVFLSFCLIFVWEQGLFKGMKRPLLGYWRSQLLLLLGWLLLLALDVVQQARQQADVFSSRPDWLRLCMAVLLILNALYVLLVCVAAGRGWRRGWRQAALPGRYRAAMALTCVTVAAACVEHAERRESDNMWFWSWKETRPTAGHLLYVGMLVWYNVFVLTLLLLYMPTRPLVELASPPAYDADDELKTPLKDVAEPEPIKRGLADREP